MTIDDIEQELLGTCNDISNVEHGRADDADVLAEIGQRENIERCTACSWWCETHELVDFGDEPICADCSD